MFFYIPNSYIFLGANKISAFKLYLSVIQMFVMYLCVGEKLWEVQCESPTFTVAWHPKRPLLAYACDDKEGKYDSNREAGTVKLFGLPNDS